MTPPPPAPPPTVVVVSGHMVDAPGRETPRFRPDQVDRVTGEVRQAFDDWKVGPATTVVTGGARGADIIAAEEALARGAHVRLRLALPPDEFEARSVDIPGTDWSARFRAVLEKAQVRTLADHVQPVPEGDGVFARTNQWIIEESTALAGGRPHAVIVWNGQTGDGPGGTADFVARLGFSKPEKSIVVIDPTYRRYEARQAQAQDQDTGKHEPKRILSLDGGGIRGVLSLEILARIEEGLRDRQGDKDLRLGDWFDYIGGTSTGAIIAAGLARGLTVAELLEHYEALGRKSFSLSSDPVTALYREGPLRKALVDIFDRVGTLGHPDLHALLLVVLHNTETDSAWPLSNCTKAKYNRADRYLLPQPDRNLDLSLIELLRGSSAAPVYFRPQEIVVGKKPYPFQDGGITPFNNPALLLFLMATLPEYGLKWQVGEDKLLVVSVGTGTTPAVHENLLAHRVGIWFNARNLTSVFMNGASVGQDLLCRALGCCRFGERLDREVGDRLNVTGVAGSNLFTYVRYNAALTDDYLGRLGITDKRRRKRVRKLNGVKAIKDLRTIGCKVAEGVDLENHFKGFL